MAFFWYEAHTKTKIPLKNLGKTKQKKAFQVESLFQMLKRFT